MIHPQSLRTALDVLEYQARESSTPITIQSAFEALQHSSRDADWQATMTDLRSMIDTSHRMPPAPTHQGVGDPARQPHHSVASAAQPSSPLATPPRTRSTSPGAVHRRSVRSPHVMHARRSVGNMHMGHITGLTAGPDGASVSASLPYKRRMSHPAGTSLENLQPPVREPATGPVGCAVGPGRALPPALDSRGAASTGVGGAAGNPMFPLHVRPHGAQRALAPRTAWRGGITSAEQSDGAHTQDTPGSGPGGGGPGVSLRSALPVKVVYTATPAVGTGNGKGVGGGRHTGQWSIAATAGSGDMNQQPWSLSQPVRAPPLAAQARGQASEASAHALSPRPGGVHPSASPERSQGAAQPCKLEGESEGLEPEISEDHTRSPTGSPLTDRMSLLEALRAIKRLQSEKAALQAELESAQSEVNEMEDFAVVRSKEAARLRANHRQTQLQLHEREADLQAAQDELSSLQEQAESQSGELQRLRHQLRTQRNAVASETSSRDELAQDLAAANTTIVSLRGDVEHWQRESADLQSQLKQRSAELQEAQQAHQAALAASERRHKEQLAEARRQWEEQARRQSEAAVHAVEEKVRRSADEALQQEMDDLRESMERMAAEEQAEAVEAAVGRTEERMKAEQDQAVRQAVRETCATLEAQHAAALESLQQELEQKHEAEMAEAVAKVQETVAAQIASAVQEALPAKVVALEADLEQREAELSRAWESLRVRADAVNTAREKGRMEARAMLAQLDRQLHTLERQEASVQESAERVEAKRAELQELERAMEKREKIVSDQHQRLAAEAQRHTRLRKGGSFDDRAHRAQMARRKAEAYDQERAAHQTKAVRALQPLGELLKRGSSTASGPDPSSKAAPGAGSSQPRRSSSVGRRPQAGVNGGRDKANSERVRRRSEAGGTKPTNGRNTDLTADVSDSNTRGAPSVQQPKRSTFSSRLQAAADKREARSARKAAAAASAKHDDHDDTGGEAKDAESKESTGGSVGGGGDQENMIDEETTQLHLKAARSLGVESQESGTVSPIGSHSSGSEQAVLSGLWAAPDGQRKNRVPNVRSPGSAARQQAGTTRGGHRQSPEGRTEEEEEEEEEGAAWPALRQLLHVDTDQAKADAPTPTWSESTRLSDRMADAITAAQLGLHTQQHPAAQHQRFASKAPVSQGSAHDGRNRGNHLGGAEDPSRGNGGSSDTSVSSTSPRHQMELDQFLQRSNAPPGAEDSHAQSHTADPDVAATAYANALSKVADHLALTSPLAGDRARSSTTESAASSQRPGVSPTVSSSPDSPVPLNPLPSQQLLERFARGEASLVLYASFQQAMTLLYEFIYAKEVTLNASRAWGHGGCLPTLIVCSRTKVLAWREMFEGLYGAGRRQKVLVLQGPVRERQSLKKHLPIPDSLQSRQRRAEMASQQADVVIVSHETLRKELADMAKGHWRYVCCVWRNGCCCGWHCARCGADRTVWSHLGGGGPVWRCRSAYCRTF